MSRTGEVERGERTGTGAAEADTQPSGPPRIELHREVCASLSEQPPRLPPKLFYDARGAQLFSAITELPEYYLTRTELGILDDCLSEVAQLTGAGARVVEFGSGSGEKTWKLLDALEQPATCVPIDIAREQLLEFAERVRREHPEMEVVPLAADYTRPFRLPPSVQDEGTTLFFFPGSTIGNFEPEAAVEFLGNMRRAGGEGAMLLLGADRVKPTEVLLPAYNDARGVTADFNRNALRNVNRLLGGDFQPEAFEHEAIWNAEKSRIEMWLVARSHQEVTLDPGWAGVEPCKFRIRAGEAIVTEHSYKFTDQRLAALCDTAGWTLQQSWTDERQWFGVHLFEAR